MYAGNPKPHELVEITHKSFDDPDILIHLLGGVDAIIHYAGVNRGPEDHVATANPEIARQLVQACIKAKVKPAIVYANSIHAQYDTTAYGRSKRQAGEILEAFAERYTDLVLPHIFGEHAKPHYNNVTATLIDALYTRVIPEINPQGKVNLLHAGEAADIALRAVFEQVTGTINPPSRELAIDELYEKLKGFQDLYNNNIFPDVSDPLDLQLFNTYRSAGFPASDPRKLIVHKDSRGTLFETTKGGRDSQTFVSTTAPGITRGDHFHINKIERFLVLQGEAVIRLRKVLTDEIYEFKVSGKTPVAVDIIPLYTHSIENTGDSILYALFWTHEMHNPDASDTYADTVLR